MKSETSSPLPEPSWCSQTALRVVIRFSRADISAPHTPVAVNVDFGRHVPDPSTFVLMEVDQQDRQTRIPHRLTEAWRERATGAVEFVVRNPNSSTTFVLYFDPVSAQGRTEVSAGSGAPAEALVGNGDILRYAYGAPGQLDPAMPIHLPVPVDWDGDGKTDLVCGSIYANTIGFPYNGSWFYRNAGTDAAPVYDDFIRLKADGTYIETCVFDAVDWTGNGLIDLICKPYGANEIHVYDNTGKRDRNSLPVLTRGESVDFAPLIGKGGQTGIGNLQLYDLHGDGRLSVVAVIRELADKSRYGHIFGPYYTNAILVFENLAAPGTPPRFNRPYRMTLEDGSPLSLEGPAGGSVCDWDSDGVWDVVLAETVGDTQYLRLFHNAGTNDTPALKEAGLLEDGRRPFRHGRYVSIGTRSGFVAAGCDCTFRFLEDAGRRSDERSGVHLRDRGPLLQWNAPVSVGSYSWPWVCDWDGDGGRDIVAGSSCGVLWLIEEAGRADPPIHVRRRPVEADGRPIRHTWWRDIGQTGGERTEGYWQPAVYDWDNDGLPDLIIPVGISHGKMVDGVVLPEGRLYFYRNVGTREQPRFSEPKEMLLPNGRRPVATHSAFVLDWDGDGRGEIVALDMEQRFCVFHAQTDQAIDPTTLLPGEPLRMEDGALFTAQTVYDVLGRPWGIQHAVCDWHGKGVWDVLVGTREMLLLFANVGTNEEPRFAPGERLSLWGEPLKHSVHNLRPFPVDWDGSGRTDLLVGSESGWFHLFRRPALDGLPPQARVGRIRGRA